MSDVSRRFDPSPKAGASAVSDTLSLLALDGVVIAGGMLVFTTVALSS